MVEKVLLQLKVLQHSQHDWHHIVHGMRLWYIVWAVTMWIATQWWPPRRHGSFRGWLVWFLPRFVIVVRRRLYTSVRRRTLWDEILSSDIIIFVLAMRVVIGAVSRCHTCLRRFVLQPRPVRSVSSLTLVVMRFIYPWIRPGISQGASSISFSQILI